MHRFHSPFPTEKALETARHNMVRQQLEDHGIHDQRVLAAMRKVPRHRFVPSNHIARAYEDGPLPIAEGQTISQPYIVALMTQTLAPQPHERLLEVGAGSGYQAAILAELSLRVTAIERFESLALKARQRLAKLGYENISLQVGDGTLGYPPDAPYDGILVAAVGPRIPPPLLEQLADGGRLIMPVEHGKIQTLMRIRREGTAYHEEALIEVRFVPLIGQYGYK
jgi:protein-L-isoaspartate(D-aspartate) O-methyltransferase